MAGIKTVLFRIVGDERKAVESLDHVAAKLTAFSRIHADAEAGLDTGEANKRLDDLNAQLDKLALRTDDVEIGADTSEARRNVEELQAWIASQDATIDIKTRRAITDRILAVTRQVQGLSDAVETADSNTSSWFTRLSNTAVNFGPFTTQLRTFVPLVLAASAAIASVVGALGALVASAASAAAGLGALAVAFGGTLAPAIGVGIIAFKEFNDQLGKTGSLADRVSKQVQRLGRGFNLGQIARPLERGTLAVTRRAAGLNVGQRLTPALQGFSRDAGQAVRDFGRVVLRPNVVRQFVNLIEKAGDAIRPLGRIAGDVFRILMNIAQAAMPFLKRALEGFANGLDEIRRRTSNIKDLREVIGHMVNNLEAWLSLLHQITRVFAGFVQAASPQGRKLVEWFAKGAKALADWINSEDGRKRIRTFLKDVLPLFQQLVNFLARATILFLELGELTAPLLAPLVKQINDVLGVLIKVIDWLNTNAGAWKKWAGEVIAAIKLPFLAQIRLVQLIREKWGAITGFLSGLWRNIKEKAGQIWGAITDTILHAPRRIAHQLRDDWNSIKNWLVEHIWRNGILQAAKDIWGRIKSNVVGPAKDTARLVVNAFDGLKGRLSQLWDGITGVLGDIWRGIKGKASDIWEGIKTAILTPIRAIKGVMDKIWSGIEGAIRTAARVISRLVNRLGGTFISLMTTLASIGGGVIGVVKSVAGTISRTLRWIIGQVNSALDALGAIKDKVDPSAISVSPPGIDIKHVGPVPVPVPHLPHVQIGPVSLPQKGGVFSKVPGSGSGDKWPFMALMEPGELFGVVNRRGAEAIDWINEAIPRFGKRARKGGTYPMVTGDTDFLPALGNALSSMAQATRTAIFVQEGRRTLAEQAARVATMNAGGPVAAPATPSAPHVRGIAADITPGREVFGGVAGKYGLAFTVPSESWHIELIKAGAAAVGAAVDLIKKITFKAPGPFGPLGQRSIDMVRDAANKKIQAAQPALPSAPTAKGAFSAAQLAQLWMSVGGPKDWAAMMAQVALAESGGDPNAHNSSGATGLWQILGAVVPGNLFDPTVNAKNALKKWQDASPHLQPWYASMATWGGYARAHGFLHKGIRDALPGLAILGDRGPELAHIPRHTNVHDAQRSRRILERLAHPAFAEKTPAVIVHGDIVSQHPDPVELVIGDRRFPVAVQNEIDGETRFQRQHQRMRR